MKEAKPILRLFIFVLWIPFLVPSEVAASHPNLERGFETAKAYAMGEIDNVNLFNGNLILTIPIGNSYHVGGHLSYGLNLVYNGKSWDWYQETGGLSRAMAPWDSNAGFGWQLHFGKLVRPGRSAYGEPDSWVYLSPDGGEHEFFASLHPGEPETPGIAYTRDGSYLRLKLTSPVSATVEFPNGIKHTFGKMDAIEQWLTRMEDAFGNSMTVSYPAGAASSEWLVSDSTGRSHRVLLVEKRLDQRLVKFVSSVELAAFGDTVATYSFSYQSAELDRPVPHDPLTGYPIRNFFPLLTRVGQPDGSYWDLPVNFYSRLRDDQGVSGQLTKLRLPTGGFLAWTWSRWRFPTDVVDDPPPGTPNQAAYYEFSPGVATRRSLAPGGHEIGVWTYSSALSVPAGFPTVKPVAKTTTVVDPLGHRTVHYFGVFLGNGVPASHLAQSWQYGLPFSVMENDGEGRFVSQRIYRSGQSEPVRTDWVRYESDLYESGGYSGGNSRVSSSRVDWSGRFKKETLSDFDGLGHYRRRRLEGDYRTDNGGPGNWQNSFTAFNAGRGTYPGSFTPIPAADRWILGTFSTQWTEESWGRQAREYLFDDRGYLSRERALLQTNGERHANDTVLVRTRNAAGETIGEAFYGGYFQALGTGSLAGLALPTTAATAFEMTYQFGQGKTRRYAGASYKLADYTLDRNTGYPSAARDIAGIATSYSYDTMGRRTWIKPEAGHDAFVELRYQAAGPDSPQAFVYERPNGSTTALLRESRLVFDGFGRLVREGKDTSSGWSFRDRAYDSAGNLSAMSQWQSGTPTHWTGYESFDPFGRAEKIVRPDGKVLRLVHHGDWGLQRWFYVATSRSSDGNIQERQSASAEDFDILGRTWRYQELDQEGVLNLDAFYRYTAGGDLTEILLRAPNGNSQRRSFTFDGRGFLTAEWHPETGETLYSQIDARGHANRKQHVASGLDLGFAYDAYERLLKIWDRSRIADLKTWTYGAANASGNWKMGKVEKAVHYNRRLHPFATGEVWIDVPVEETFLYGGRGGRVSSRTTTLNGVYSFSQSATWGALGELTQENYPRCSAGPCAGLGPPRVQSYLYDRGDLVSTAGWGSFAYHDNGMLARSTHGNGVVDTIAKDPHQLPRPYNIRIGGFSPPAQLGVHVYDGGGNLVQLRPENGAQSFHQLTEPPAEIAPAASAILETFFLYDAYGRLRTWNDVTGRAQNYDFDAFGNLVKVTDFNGFSPPTARAFAVSQATNQLNTLVAYDARGNLTRRSLGNLAESYQWDLFDQLAAQNGRSQTHLYTADGERVWTLRYDAASTQTDETFTLRGMANQVLTVYRHQANSATGLNSWTWEEDYLYRGSQLLAKATSKPAPWNQVHFTLDHLGTPRVATGSSGQPLETYHYFPYGEQHGGATASTERMRFTGNERDQNAPGSADDLDYKHARYSSPNRKVSMVLRHEGFGV